MTRELSKDQFNKLLLEVDIMTQKAEELCKLADDSSQRIEKLNAEGYRITNEEFKIMSERIDKFRFIVCQIIGLEVE